MDLNNFHFNTIHKSEEQNLWSEFANRENGYGISGNGNLNNIYLSNKENTNATKLQSFWNMVDDSASIQPSGSFNRDAVPKSGMTYPTYTTSATLSTISLNKNQQRQQLRDVRSSQHFAQNGDLAEHIILNSALNNLHAVRQQESINEMLQKRHAIENHNQVIMQRNQLLAALERAPNNPVDSQMYIHQAQFMPSPSTTLFPVDNAVPSLPMFTNNFANILNIHVDNGPNMNTIQSIPELPVFVNNFANLGTKDFAVPPITKNTLHDSEQTTSVVLSTVTPSMTNIENGKTEKTKPMKNNVLCTFCKRNGELMKTYKNHSLHEGKAIACPVLKKCICGICGKSGHTLSHCIKNPNKTSVVRKFVE